MKLTTVTSKSVLFIYKDLLVKMSEVLNLQLIRDKFTESLCESDDILLTEYLDSYQELNK